MMISDILTQHCQCVNQSEWKKGWFVNILIIQTLFSYNFTDDTIKKNCYDGFGNK